MFRQNAAYRQLSATSTIHLGSTKDALLTSFVRDGPYQTYIYDSCTPMQHTMAAPKEQEEATSWLHRITSWIAGLFQSKMASSPVYCQTVFFDSRYRNEKAIRKGLHMVGFVDEQFQMRVC